MIKEIMKRFKFDSEEDLNVWSCSFIPDYLYEKDESAVLYTDGDCGIALISFSEIFDEDGIMIELIDCTYCDIRMSDLKKIHKHVASWS